MFPNWKLFDDISPQAAHLFCQCQFFQAEERHDEQQNVGDSCTCTYVGGSGTFRSFKLSAWSGIFELESGDNVMNLNYEST